MLARVLPTIARAALEAACRAGQFLAELADALKGDGPVPTLVSLHQALSEHDVAIAELRRDGSSWR